MHRILLIGKNGQLGWELQRTLATLGEVIALDYPEVDLAKPDRLREIIRSISPTILVNAAAYTNVDKAESEAELAWKINAEAPGVMAEEACRLKAEFIHYSTDYVFDGKKISAYFESDATNPLNEYGRSKLGGEQKVEEIAGAHLVFRTSWVYSMRQSGFVTKVLQWARQQETLRVVDDQIGCPTSARMLAEVTAQVIAQGGKDPMGYFEANRGLYHLAGKGAASRYEWAKAIVEFDPRKEEQKVTEIQPAMTREFPTPATRPLRTELQIDKFENTFELTLPSWRESLKLLIE